MQLNEFVAQTLIQIINGVTSAQREVCIDGAIINPQLNAGPEFAGALGLLWYGESDGSYAQVVKFNVDLAVTQEKEGNASIGVLAAVISLNGKGHARRESTSTTSISFSISILFL